MVRRRDAWLADLAAIPLFARCTPKELRAIARRIDHLRFDAGAVVIRQGAPGHEMFVIDEGTVEVIRGGELVDTMGPGDHFGEMALLHDAPRDATVRACTPLRVLVLSAASVRELLDEIPWLRDELLALDAARRTEPGAVL